MPHRVSQEQIAQAIREYLALQPRAADTVEGIRQWWLPVASRGALLSDVQAAVKLLMEQEVLESVSNKSGTTIYRARER